MNELQNFDFKGNSVRTLSIKDEPYFVGKDVANILGYERSDNAIRSHVDVEDKLTHQISASGQKRNMTIINESGLYSLILSSKLPSAKEFKRWITSEVLPAIRKHGAYMTSEVIEKTISDPDFIIGLATQLKEERTGRLIAEQQVQELQPKADYYDSILANKGLVAIGTIAKNYGMSSTAFNKLLHQLGVQYKQSKTWLLYSKYQSKGYTHTVPVPFEHADGRKDISPQTKWTQKGHIFIYELLKSQNILPMIEQ